MTPEERGKRGGRETVRRRGSAYMARIGRAGGRAAQAAGGTRRRTYAEIVASEQGGPRGNLASTSVERGTRLYVIPASTSQE